jgi:hypothetical protein
MVGGHFDSWQGGTGATEASAPTAKSSARPSTTFTYRCVRFLFDSFERISKSFLITTVRASPDRRHAKDGVRPRRSGQARTDQLSAVVPLLMPLSGRLQWLLRSVQPQGAERPNLARPFGLLAALVPLIRPLLLALPLGPSGPQPAPHSSSTPATAKGWLPAGLDQPSLRANQATEAVLRRGSNTVNVEPTPGDESTSREPSICSTILREM